MKALQFRAARDVSVVDLDIPVLSKGEMLVQVKAAAICGTDRKIFASGHPHIHGEIVPGHEISGVVVDANPVWRESYLGKRVLIAAPIGCGCCSSCLSGKENECPELEVFGFHHDGGFAEYLRVPEKAAVRGNVIPLPDGVSFEVAALVEPLSCVLNGQLPLEIGENDAVTIIGGGAIGSMHALLARARNAKKIFLGASSPEKTASLQKKFPWCECLDASQSSFRQIIFDRTENRGSDVVIVACSVKEVHSLALEIAACHGRISFFAGLKRGDSTAALDVNLIHYRALSIFGSFGSSVRQHSEVLALIASEKLDPSLLISERLTLEEAGRALALAPGLSLKQVVCF